MLLESELKAITSQTGMMNKTFNLHYTSGQPGALKEAVSALCKEVEEAVRNGCEVTTRFPQILCATTVCMAAATDTSYAIYANSGAWHKPCFKQES